MHASCALRSHCRFRLVLTFLSRFTVIIPAAAIIHANVVSGDLADIKE